MKQFIIFQNKLYYAYFQNLGNYSRIEDAQGSNIVFAPSHCFELPKLPLKTMWGFSSATMLFKGIEIWGK